MYNKRGNCYPLKYNCPSVQLSQLEFFSALISLSKADNQ